MPDIVRKEGELLVVPHGARLARICVSCADRNAVTHRLEELSHISIRAWVIAASLLLVGWLLCLLMMESPFVAISLPVVFVHAVVIGRLTHRGVISLPVCSRCDARWRFATRTKSLATLSLVPATAVAVAALFALPSSVAAPISAASLLLWAAAFMVLRRVVERRNALVAPVSIDPVVMRLRGVHPEALRELVAAALSEGVYR